MSTRKTNMQFPTSSYLTVIIIATGLLRHAGAFPTKSSAVQLQRRGQCCTKSSFTEDSLHNNDIEDDPDESVVSAAEFDWVWDNFAEPIIPETVERTVDPSVYTRPGPYKLQYSLRVLSNDGKLEEGTKGIKENAIIKGAGIRQTLGAILPLSPLPRGNSFDTRRLTYMCQINT